MNIGEKKTAPSTLELVAIKQTQKATGSIHQNSKTYSNTAQGTPSEVSQCNSEGPQTQGPASSKALSA